MKLTAPIEMVELDATQKRQWDETRTALVWHCPAFSHIFYTLLQNSASKDNAIFTRAIPVAATDGANLLFNPDTFFKMSLMERVFVTSHEILHCILNHMIIGHHARMRGKVAFTDGKDLPYDDQTMNAAMDYVINSTLIESKVGSMPKKPNGEILGLYDANVATSADNSFDTYKKIFKKNDGGGGGKNKVIIVSGGFDEHLEPGTSQGKDAQSASNDRNQAQWDTEIAAGIASARAQGKLPAGLDRLLSDVLTPQVDWREKIRALFNRKVGSGTFDWRRPDRRLITRDIYAPGRSGFGAGDVVIGIDTSGSIGGPELDMFMAEMAGILEDVRPKRLVIMWCDAHVHRVDEAEDTGDLNVLRSKGAPGGGGTSFIPVFDEIKKLGLNPEALVYMTDGMGSFPPAEPPYPVIWGNIYPQSKYPFGDVVDIPRQPA